MEKDLRAYLFEFVGTFMVVFLTAGVVCVNHLAAVHWGTPERGVLVQPAPGLLGIAVVAGFSYAAALAITVPVSGGYLNPAITLTLWVFRRLDGGRVAGLILAQLLAGVLAGLVLRVILPEDLVLTPARIGTPHLNPKVWSQDDPSGITLMLKGVGLEAVFAALLVFALFALLIDPRWAGARGWAGRLAPLWLGLLVTALTLVGYNLTGTGLNPARWFGTVVWEVAIPELRLQGPFYDHLVYWLGPTAGALLAGSLYSGWVLPRESEPGGPPH